ncbi:amidase [Acuticoccus sediminis]|uniref:Indoleacetamide hydrolase n=1 Tax=Acuticoccus sediminis TaxID=2184697 RepID=A0A8B2NL63_9HYPH|nr:amidase [Acuticoccus sediminis]RAI00246.1 amidase [Acuticoccus sediminis]
MTDLAPERAADLAAVPLARAYLTGDADPVAVTEVLLERIADDDNAVFISTAAERALREARSAKARYDAGRPASSLDGVPVAWKDLFDMAGEVTTAGSNLLRNATPAEEDSPVVAFLASAGMVALGKTNLTEFAFSGLGLNPHYGTPANPHDKDTPRIPGGSSSGSAVAVASGLATTAIGSDTGGSVRIPAAVNGLVGYKSSEGRITKEKVVPLSVTLDTVGPIARTVEDCVHLDAALRGVAPTIRRGNVAGMRLIVCETLWLDDCEEVVTDAFEKAIKRLEQAGVTVETRNIPQVAEAARIGAEHGTITAAEAYAYHRESVEGADVEEMDGRVVSRILRGKTMTAQDLLANQTARVTLSRQLGQEMEDAFIVGPTVPHVAPEIAPLDADWEVFNRVNLKTLRNTMTGNFLNMPGVAMPMASTSSLPVSFLLNAKSNDDDRLLSAALAIEHIVRGE